MQSESQKPGFFDRLSNLFPNRKLKREQLEHLRELMRSAVADGIITDKELGEINGYLKTTELTHEEFIRLRNEIFNEVLMSCCADRRVTPEEERMLKGIGLRLGMSTAEIEQVDQYINYFALLHAVETCPLEQLPAMGGTGLILQPVEKAYMSFACSLLEERVINRQYVGGSRGVSVRIMRGVTYRVGQSRGQLVNQTGIVPVSWGDFTVTNKRLIFSGDRKSFNSPYNKLLDIEVYSDGLRLSVTNRQKPIYIQFPTTEASELTAMYISRVLNG